MELSLKIYEHAAALLRRTPWEVSRDPELLAQAHAAAYRLYGHAPIIPAIDHYNLEPEAYGAAVEKPDGLGVPAVTRPAFSSVAALLELDPWLPHRRGRLPVVIEVAKRLAREFPKAHVAVPVTGPFSIASSLLGFDSLLCAVADAPESVAKALRHLAEGQLELARQIQVCELEVAFAESAAGPPLLSPAAFRSLELPALKWLLAGMARVFGHPVPCILGGDTLQILDALLETGTNYLVCPSETDQAVFLKKVWDRTHIHVRVNMRSSLIARGAWPEIQAEAERILRLLRDRPNVCVGTGVLPYETRPENVLRLREFLVGR